MIFVLGVERSATTWVSNILDMHPATSVYMEPLATNISQFKNWPDRFVELQNPQKKADTFRAKFADLEQQKRFLLTNIIDSNWAWRWDLFASQKLWGGSSRARNFYELNFHRLGTSGYPTKQSSTLDVVKELRLNYNIPLIKEIDPDVKVVVALRNYAANVQSIARQINNGNLSELEDLLQKKYGQIDTKTIFRYWADSYNSMLAELDSEDIDYLVLRQEDLIQSGKETVETLLTFLELPPAPTVDEYLVQSNTSGVGKHSTKRDHATILQQNSDAENKLSSELAATIAEINWHSVLKNEFFK